MTRIRRESNHLLDTITLKGPNPVVKKPLGEYQLAYLPSPDTERSRLASVSRCDNNDVCLRSKTFRWWDRTTPGHPPVEFDDVSIAPWDLASITFPKTLVADFNGDGLDDILYRVVYSGDNRPIYLRLAHVSAGVTSFGPETQMTQAGHDFASVVLERSRAVDTDGDGRNELLAAVDPDLDYASTLVAPGYMVFSLNTDTMAFEEKIGSYLPGDPDLDVVQLTDVNGDGLLDMFREQPDSSQGSGASDLGKWQLAVNQNGGFSSSADSTLLSVQGSLARAMDIDGDGRGDLLPIDWETVQDGTSDDPSFPGSTIALGLNDQGQLASDERWRLHGFNSLELVDLNGDGSKIL